MNISLKRNRLHITSNDLMSIESTHIVGWTPKFSQGYATANKDIQGLVALLKQLDYKPKATNDIKEWYAKEISKLTLANNIIKGDFKLSKFNHNEELKDYQKQAISYFENMNNCIIGYDMGLGKSLIGINCIKSIKAKKTLIICPSYLKYSWSDEIKKWCPKLTHTVIQGTPKQREQQFKEFEDNNKYVLIINYEQVRVKLTKTKKFESTNVHPYIQNTVFDLIIWDEAHRLKTRDSQNSLGALAINSINKIMLTGTVITKNPGEIYSLLRILDKERFTSYWTFVNHYCKVTEGFRGVEIGHVIKPKQFKELLNQYMIRKLKEDVALELPDKIFINIPVVMGSKQIKLYNKALKEYLNPDDSIITTDVERFIRMCQVAQNPVIIDGDDVSIVKDTILDLIDDLNDRVMIGCTYIKMSSDLQKSIQEKYYIKDRKVYLINSQIKNRYDIVESFKKDKTGILVTTIKCLAEGANIDCCDNMIFADIEWNCGVNNQFMNRIHRMTSTRLKNYFYIIVKDSIHDYKHQKINNEAVMVKSSLGDSDQKIINTVMSDFRRDMILKK